MTTHVATLRTPTRVVSARQLSPLVRELVLEFEQPYVWRGGQHLSLSRGSIGAPESYYSFGSAFRASSPERCELVIGSGPATIGELQFGDLLYAGPARGLALLDHFEAAQSLGLIGMGTGIAPLRATLQEAESRVDAPVFSLLHGCRNSAELLFAEEFRARAQAAPFHYLPVLSRAEPEWQGPRGHVQAHLSLLGARLDGYVVCGSRAMVDDVTAWLLEQGVPRERIVGEGY